MTMSDQTERMEDALRRVIGEKIAAEVEAERLQNTGVRADERREMQKAVAEALAAEIRATKAEAEAEELRGLAKAAQMNYIEESLEAERLRAALDGHHAAWATKWENCSICRALAGTEAGHRKPTGHSSESDP